MLGVDSSNGIRLAVSSMDVKNVLAGSYEKTQSIAQASECGNYWFPLDVLCFNLSSQICVPIASAHQPTESSESRFQNTPLRVTSFRK
jgi:hypothetical protein